MSNGEGASPAQVIIGATGGIGSALAKRLHKNGSRLFLAGRTQEKLDALCAELDAPGCTVDATDFESVEECLRRARASRGRVAGLVNCVGSVFLKPTHITTAAEWSATLAVNLTSAFAAVRAGVDAMRAHGGSIVLISSAAAMIGLANHEATAAAKAGVIGLMRSAAATYASKQIRVNAVAPGLVETRATDRLRANEAAVRTSRAMHALGRFGQAEEVAAAVEFFLQPENAWVTGQVLAIDGGLSSVRTRPQG